MRALDLYCGGGGVSEGLRRAGFEVVGVDIADHSRVYRRGPGRLCLSNPATFVRADALVFLEEVLRGEHGHFDLICASPPCQGHTSLRHLQRDKVYPDLIPQTRALLERWAGLWCIENVPGAPLGGANLTMLCGTMFGLQTPDGRAELRRHRVFETSFSIPLRPCCQHGLDGCTVTGHTAVQQRAINRRRALSVPGNTAQINVVRNTIRETFSTSDARHAMGIDWMSMKELSQAIPPAYAEWIAREALDVLGTR